MNVDTETRTAIIGHMHDSKIISAYRSQMSTFDLQSPRLGIEPKDVKFLSGTTFGATPDIDRTTISGSELQAIKARPEIVALKRERDEVMSHIGTEYVTIAQAPEELQKRYHGLKNERTKLVQRAIDALEKSKMKPKWKENKPAVKSELVQRRHRLNIKVLDAENSSLQEIVPPNFKFRTTTAVDPSLQDILPPSSKFSTATAVDPSLQDIVLSNSKFRTATTEASKSREEANQHLDNDDNDDNNELDNILNIMPNERADVLLQEDFNASIAEFVAACNDPSSIGDA